MANTSLLWRFQHAHSPGSSYLFGTMHVRDERVFESINPVYDTISKCEAFAAEFDLSQADPALTAKYMQLPEDYHLSDLCSDKKYAQLSAAFTNLTGVPIKHFEKQKPLVLYNVLTELYFQKDMPQPMDFLLMEFARESNKHCFGVETYEEQLEILDKLPLKDQMKSLIWACNNPTKYFKQLEKATKLYQEGNIKKLLHIAAKEDNEMQKILLDDRNIRMAKRMAKISKTQTVFYAIGAGHLSGKNGLIELLGKKGYVFKAMEM